jgi:tRNA-binding protein
MELSWTEFEKIECSGNNLEVSDFPEAKPAYQLTIDFGLEIGILKSSLYKSNVGGNKLL